MKEIKVIKIEERKEPKEEVIKNEYEEIKNFVGGYIETLPIDNTHLIVCDEEGKLKGYSLSVYIVSAKSLKIVDTIVGNCFITKVRSSDFSSLSKEDLKELSKRIQYDEQQKVTYIFI